MPSIVSLIQGIIIFVVMSFCCDSFADAAFRQITLPTHSHEIKLTAFFREAIYTPTRYRIVVIPGSGCQNFSKDADRYFKGLLHADVLVLQKPYTDLDATLAPTECSEDFVQYDSLENWANDAKAALQEFVRLGRTPNENMVPTLLVGISEGAEIVPYVSGTLPNLVSVVIVSSSGLDPFLAYELQAKNSGFEQELSTLRSALSNKTPAQAVIYGRSLNYWRTMELWSLEKQLLMLDTPLLQVFGTNDRNIPQQAYDIFRERMKARSSPFCRIVFRDADHGLQTPQQDGVKKLWAILEILAKSRQNNICNFDSSLNRNNAVE